MSELNVFFGFDLVNEFTKLRDEYKKEHDENVQLKSKINELYNINENHKEIIKQNERTIQQLKEENKMLRQTIQELKTTIQKLEQESIKRNEKEQFTKYVIAIQDINRLEKLETKLYGDIKTKLLKLKRVRIGKCHYIDDDLDEDETNDRRTVLYERIQKMPPQIKQMFEDKYKCTGLLPAIMKFIVHNKTIPSDESLTEIDDWWEF